jgi:hypothetical protein
MSECEDKLAKIMESFKKVNASRNANVRMNKIMSDMIIKMLIDSKGWLNEDLDTDALNILNNYQKIKDGFQQ